MFNFFLEEKLEFQERYQETICDITDPTEVLEATKVLDNERSNLEEKHKEEIKQYDMGTILRIDQLAMDQQSTLEKAGLPGFFVTNDPKSIKVQMHLLKCITKIGASASSAKE